MQQYLNHRQWYEWQIYSSLYGLGADRTDITVSHQTFHLMQAWLNGDKRQPKDFAPQFSRDQPLNEAEEIMAEIRSSI